MTPLKVSDSLATPWREVVVPKEKQNTFFSYKHKYNNKIITSDSNSTTEIYYINLTSKYSNVLIYPGPKDCAPAMLKKAHSRIVDMGKTYH